MKKECPGFGNLDASMAEGFPTCESCSNDKKIRCLNATHAKLEKYTTENREE